jgi:Mn2+/Fe2+ NRAMP family transporter
MVATDAPVSFAGRLRHLGPGIIVAGSIVGSGELVLTSSLGAVVGFGLLWFLLLSCWSKTIVQSELARLCILNKSTFLNVFNRLPGKLPGRQKQVSWLVWYFFLNTFITLLAAGGILGGATEAIKLIFPEWSYPGIALTLTILAALLLGSGSYQVLEKLLLLMVSSFTAISIYCAIALQFSDSAVPLTQILAAQSFDFPIKHLALIIAVFSFTGVNIGESIYYSYFCMDKGYANHIDETETVQGVARAKSWLRVMHTDVWLTLVLLTLVTIPFYILGASVLHTTGLEPDNNNMIQVISTIYTDVLGPWAKNLFLVGAFLVLYSTLLAWVGGDSRQLSDNAIELGFLPDDDAVRLQWKRGIGYVWPFTFFALLMFFETPLTMIILGAATYALTGPLVVGSILYLRKKTLADNVRSGPAATALLYVALTVMLLIGAGGIYTLF